jgi:DUF4097 and DUF4098 domain-containing protein YvlB
MSSIHVGGTLELNTSAVRIRSKLSIKGVTMRRSFLAFFTLLSATSVLNAQTFTTHRCNESDVSFSVANTACEIRSVTLPLSDDSLKVLDMNGDIDVSGEDRQDVALEARVIARSESQVDANSILQEVTIATRGAIRASGPRSTGNQNWSVSYRLRVPHRLTAKLQTLNGSLSLRGIDGNIHADTTSGNVEIADLGGDVHVSTNNGSIKARLSAPNWQGNGLSASTTNGSVTVTVPDAYSAHIVASTTHGGISTLSGGPAGRDRKDLDTILGSGGAILSFGTTNGDVLFR